MTVPLTSIQAVETNMRPSDMSRLTSSAEVFSNKGSDVKVAVGSLEGRRRDEMR